MEGLELSLLEVEVGAFSVSVPKLSVAPGRLTCLVGRSGSGKTTVLNAVAGFLPLKRGSVRLQGIDVTELPPERRRVAMCFQRGALFPHLPLWENVAFSLRCQGVGAEERRQAAERWLERVELKGLGDRRPHEVSVGQAQRVGFVRALAAGFPGVLLDEPFSALDPGNRGVLRALLKEELAHGKTAFLMVTHDVEDIRALASEVVCLSRGRVLWAADPQALDDRALVSWGPTTG